MVVPGVGGLRSTWRLATLPGASVLCMTDSLSGIDEKYEAVRGLQVAERALERRVARSAQGVSAGGGPAYGLIGGKERRIDAPGMRPGRSLQRLAALHLAAHRFAELGDRDGVTEHGGERDEKGPALPARIRELLDERLAALAR